MPSYKVKCNVVQEYVFDVVGENESQAKELAQEGLNEADATGTLHFHEYGDSFVEDWAVFDVTGTDDDFTK